MTSPGGPGRAAIRMYAVCLQNLPTQECCLDCAWSSRSLGGSTEPVLNVHCRSSALSTTENLFFLGQWFSNKLQGV